MGGTALEFVMWLSWGPQPHGSRPKLHLTKQTILTVYEEHQHVLLGGILVGGCLVLTPTPM